MWIHRFPFQFVIIISLLLLIVIIICIVGINSNSKSSKAIIKYNNDYEQYLKKEEVLDKFIQEHGPFDVIHFHSFEGISTNVLQLKKKYPSIRFIHSTHDYGILCPNVRLWNNKNENYFVAAFISS